MTKVLIVSAFAAISLLVYMYFVWAQYTLKKAGEAVETSFLLEYKLEGLCQKYNNTPWWHFRANHKILREIGRLKVNDDVPATGAHFNPMEHEQSK